MTLCMYLRKIEISDIRALKRVAWALPKDHKGPGWHVILGDNGSGKSSLLQAIALALVGPDEAPALRQDFRRWLRTGSERAEITISIEPSELDEWAGKGRTKDRVELSVYLGKDESSGDDQVRARVTAPTDDSRLRRGLWSSQAGWFSAGFGPFRRFQGGGSESARLFYASPNLAPHLSLFDEGVALTEGLAWLRKLHNLARDANQKKLSAPEESVLAYLKEFVNQSELLPNGVTLESLDSEDVYFLDGAGRRVSVMELSDGFRTTLSLTFELFRLLSWTFGGQTFLQHCQSAKRDECGPHVTLPGVVLIDEVDAHLHPTWQHRIGAWCKRCFPNIQFIVTTHSPIICQAAEGGTVFKLPQPGTDEEARMLEGLELQRLVYGSVLDAFRTSAFDGQVTQSDSARALLKELATLNVKEIAEGLSEDERARQEELRTILPGRDPQRAGS